MNDTDTTQPTGSAPDPGFAGQRAALASGTQAPDPAAADPPGARRLTRRTERRMIAGVAGGIGDFLGIDPVLVRLGFAALVIFGGAGVLLYLVGWALMPPRSGGPSVVQRALDSLAAGPSWLGIVFLLAAAWLLAVQINLWSPAVTWALIFIALGVYLFRRDQSRPTGSRPSGGDLPPPPGGAAPGAWNPPGGPAAATGDAGVAHEPGQPAPPGQWQPAPPGQWQPDSPPPAPPGGIGAYPTAPWQAPPPRERAPRSILGRLTIALMLVALGVAAVLDNAGAVFMTPSRYVALALVGVGLGLVAGTWRGRSRGLLALGLALLLLLPVMNIAERIPALRDGVGSRYVTPSSMSDVRDEYALGAGELVLDLSELGRQPGDQAVQVTVGAGRLLIWAPRGWDVDTSVKVDAGEMWVFGTTVNGTDIDRRVSFRGDGSGGTLTLDLQMGVGSVTVNESFFDPDEAPEDEFHDDSEFDEEML